MGCDARKTKKQTLIRKVINLKMAHNESRNMSLKGNEPSGSIKCGEISGVAEELIVSEEGVYTHGAGWFNCSSSIQFATFRCTDSVSQINRDQQSTQIHRNPFSK
jgi:hypothetical protein